MQILKLQQPGPTCGQNAPCACRADAGYPQKPLQIGGHDLHGKLFRMCDSPVALVIQHRVKIRVRIIQQLLCAKSIEPQKPVSLIQTMLPQKGRLCVQSGEKRIFHYRDIGGIEHSFELIAVIQ